MRHILPTWSLFRLIDDLFRPLNTPLEKLFSQYFNKFSTFHYNWNLHSITVKWTKHLIEIYRNQTDALELGWRTISNSIVNSLPFFAALVWNQRLRCSADGQNTRLQSQTVCILPWFSSNHSTAKLWFRQMRHYHWPDSSASCFKVSPLWICESVGSCIGLKGKYANGNTTDTSILNISVKFLDILLTFSLSFLILHVVYAQKPSEKSKGVWWTIAILLVDLTRNDPT